MPNWVTNVIIATPNVVDKITRHYTDKEKAQRRLDRLERAARYRARTGKEWEYAAAEEAEDEERICDFNMLIPMPEAVESTSVGSDGLSSSDTSGWYGWSVQNWGTKWNAGSCSIEPLPGDLCKLTFDTAWSHPTPVIHALSAACPGEVLEVQYADEDHGGNVATYKLKDEVEFDIVQPEEYGPEALDLASQIKSGMTYAEWRADMGLDDEED